MIYIAFDISYLALNVAKYFGLCFVRMCVCQAFVQAGSGYYLTNSWACG